VVLISLDGFAASYLDDSKAPLPNLRRLAAEGARAEGMQVVTPSVTWPNHTTLVTGVTAARHGVLVNGRIERSPGSPPYFINPRRSKEELCRAPTLYDAAHRAGLRTAEVNWPVTRGAPTLD
jgi:predicted AlkP superfamily phosphohydrolase/phosphomutase